jgi:hypothetical protein
MSETVEFIVGLFFLLAVFAATRFGIHWRMKRACTHIIEDLERRHAHDPASAAVLPYASTDWLKLGLRDFRPKALASLVLNGIAAKTSDGKYYLHQGSQHQEE